jgi:hypothetical protein
MTNSIDEQIAFLQSQKQAMLVIVVAVIKIFLMNFVNFLMRVEDEVVVVVEVA